MSCAEGTRIRRWEGTKSAVLPIEDLFEGAELVGLRDTDEVPVRVLRPLRFSMKPCVKITTDAGQELTCTTDHRLLLAGGGNVRANVQASESLKRHVLTRDGAVQVVEVQNVGERRVVHLDELDRPFVYEAERILSEE